MTRLFSSLPASALLRAGLGAESEQHGRPFEIQSTAAATPPPPSLAVPVVPQMDVPSPQYSGPTDGYNNAPRPQPSFRTQVRRCQAEAAAGCFDPADRDFYVRSCVNR